MSAEPTPQRVAIVTGASQGIGAGLTAGFRSAGYAVVGTARSMPALRRARLSHGAGRHHRSRDRPARGRPSARSVRADRQLDQQRGDLHRQAVQRLHARGLCRDHGREPGGLLPHHATRHQPDGHPGKRSHRQRLNQSRGPSRQHQTIRAGGPHQGRTGRRGPFARDRIRVPRRALQRRFPRGHQDRRCTTPGPTRAWPAPIGRVGEVGDVVDAILYLERATFVTGETLHVDGGQAAGH